MADLVVAGAGMAGLVAAAEARRLGARPVVHEKLDRPGGSMRLSSGVVWRHRELDRFRAECPDGDPALQRALVERLDADLDWLESLGALVVERDTGNPLTTGVRFDVEGLVRALVAAGGEPLLETPLRELPDGVPVVLATGGFAADRELLREHVTPEAGAAMLRAARGATGDGLRLGLEAGGAASAGLGEVYARNMPAPPARVEPRDFVRLSQLYARHATVTNANGERHETRTWSEVDVGQWTARQPGARAWYRVEADALDERVRERSVREMVEAAEEAGAPVEWEREGGGRERAGGGRERVGGGRERAGGGRERAGGGREGGGRGGGGRGAVTVETVAGITTTLGGLRIDGQCAVAPGVFACGQDAGGVATGGYASGLAAALVQGRIAARAALGEEP